MFFILAGALLVAISAAALVSLPFFITRRKTPKGVPVLAAGIAIVTFVVWNDYSWFSRTAAELPESVEIVDTLTYKGALQPWTYIVPRVNRFTAVDRSAIQRNENLPGLVIAEVIFVQRYQPTLKARQIFDCRQSRRADIIPTTEFDQNGMPRNVAWVDLEDNHPLISAVCTDT